MRLIEYNMQQIVELCKRYKVSKLFVFGSILTNRFREDSDVDFVVDFQDIPYEDYADNYFGLRDGLASLFNRSVDLLEEHGIKNAVFRSNVNRTKQLIYG